MSTKTSGSRVVHALRSSRVEKDVENTYRGEISLLRPSAAWGSPYNCDGQAVWDVSTEEASTVRLLLEAKYLENLKDKMPVCSILGQMLLYLKRFEQVGDVLPNVLLVGDKNECFVLSTSAVVGFLALDIDWSVAPSTGNPELTRALVQGMNLLPYVYDVDNNLDFHEVVDKIEMLAAGTHHQVRATPTNLEAIFLYWRDRVFNAQEMPATDQVDVFLRCLFQPEAVYPHPSKRGVLVVPGYSKGVNINTSQYRSFFDHFSQGYRPSEIDRFYAMKDRLVEDGERRRQGAFFTPTLWAQEAVKEVESVLGPDWRKECVVWDPAAGTANLTRDHQDWGCLLSSTAERADVEVMRDMGWGGHHVFQYDFLNGEASPFFRDTEKNVLPCKVDSELRKAADAGKRLVVFMNPPYAEDGVSGAVGETRKGVALTDTNRDMGRLGRANRQLYAQFMYRAQKVAEEYGFTEVTVAVFSKPTFTCSGSYTPFREWWYSRQAFKSGFMFKASHFADVSDAWGISFTVWNSGTTDAAQPLPVILKGIEEFSVVDVGDKLLYNSDGVEASKWVEGRQVGNVGDTPKFSSGLKVREQWDGGSLPGSLGVMCSMGNNLMESGSTHLLSGKPTHKGRRHFDLTPENWRRATALYAARKLVKGDWVNDKDEYLKPDDGIPGYDRWVNDCHVYALLHTSNNCTAMRDVTYKGQSWRIKNNWFWRTKEDARQALDTVESKALYRDCQAESVDSYLATQLPELVLSEDARTVLQLLDDLWLKSLPLRESYAAGTPKLHLLAHDAGVYQLKHLWRELFPVEWAQLQSAYKRLEVRLRDGVYTYGFLLRGCGEGKLPSSGADTLLRPFDQES